MPSLREIVKGNFHKGNTLTHPPANIKGVVADYLVLTQSYNKIASEPAEETNGRVGEKIGIRPPLTKNAKNLIEYVNAKLEEGFVPEFYKVRNAFPTVHIRSAVDLCGEDIEKKSIVFKGRLRELLQITYLYLLEEEGISNLPTAENHNLPANSHLNMPMKDAAGTYQNN